jgi:hypothetical protein
MSFQDILQSIHEQTDRDTVASMAAKYPSLREYAELGERFRGLQTPLKSLGYSEPEPAIEELGNWRSWKRDHFDEERKMTRAEIRAQELLLEAQERISELENSRSTDVTPEEIRAVVATTLKEAGVVTGSELDRIFKSALDPKEGEFAKYVNTNINGLASRFEDVYAKVTPKIHQHAKEFDEILDPKTVFDHMQKTGQMDPIKAYDEMVGPRRAEAAEKRHLAEVEKAKAEGLKEGRMQAVSQSGRAMPADGSGGRKLGAIEMRRQAQIEARKAQTGQEPKLGSGVAAARAAEAHRAKEMASASI